MLGLRRGFCQISVLQSRAFSSLKFDNVTLGGNLLKDASFQIEQGEKVALVGQNARAKDAVMNALSGNLEPSSGNISRGDKVLLYSPRQSRGDQMQSIKEYLQNNSSNDLSEDVVKKIMENVKLGDIRAGRSLSGLTSSQQARVQLAAILLRNPDVILFDQPTDPVNGLSHDDVEDLKEFISAYRKTCVVNSDDEDFLASVCSTMLVVDEQLAGGSGASKVFRESYSAVKEKMFVKKRESHFSAAAEIRAESARRSEMLHNEDTAAALNELGFENTTAAVSQEEYIRVMMLIMASHPPVLFGLYYLGMFDAII